MTSSCQIYNFKNLLGKPTCYKNPTNPSCVDFILTNRPRSFQNSCTFETGLSDFHKMTLTVLKSSFAKEKPRTPNYRNYKFFNNILFRHQVLNQLINSNLQISDKDCKTFYRNLSVSCKRNCSVEMQVYTSKSGTLHK